MYDGMDEKVNVKAAMGVRLSRTLGVQRMTVSRLTTACGIAKGSFYGFCQSKEEFILALAAWANRKTEEMIGGKLAGRRQMSTHEFFEFFREFLYSEYDLMSGLTVDDFLWLKTHMAENDLFNPADQLEVVKTWLSLISDGVIICIAFNGVVAFVWLLEPIGISVMLPEGINTPLKKLTKAQIKPIRLMEFILYPILLAYIIISAMKQT